MPDWEKTVKGLECCQITNDHTCDECPYKKYHEPLDAGDTCLADMFSDALELLKETEPVPARRLDAWPFTIEICGNCGEVLPSIGGNKVKFCLGCGRKVKRND